MVPELPEFLAVPGSPGMGTGWTRNSLGTAHMGLNFKRHDVAFGSGLYTWAHSSSLRAK